MMTRNITIRDDETKGFIKEDKTPAAFNTLAQTKMKVARNHYAAGVRVSLAFR